MTEPSLPTLWLLDASNLLYRYHHATAVRPPSKSGQAAGGAASPDAVSPDAASPDAVSPDAVDATSDTRIVQGIVAFVERVLRDHRPHAIAWVEDAGDSGRRSEDEAYKSTRVRLDDVARARFEAGATMVRAALDALRIQVLRVQGYEADDTIGTMARRVAVRGWQVVVVSQDKDMYQLVEDRIHLFHPGRGGRQPIPDRRITPENAHERLGVPPHQVVDFLALVGDGVDNVRGVDGIGEKGAVELLQEYGSLTAILERASDIKKKRYREAILAGRDSALQSARLVRLQTEVPVPQGLDLRVKPRHPGRWASVVRAYDLRDRPDPAWLMETRAERRAAAQAAASLHPASEGAGPEPGSVPDPAPHIAPHVAPPPAQGGVPEGPRAEEHLAGPPAAPALPGPVPLAAPPSHDLSSPGSHAEEEAEVAAQEPVRRPPAPGGEVGLPAATTGGVHREPRDSPQVQQARATLAQLSLFGDGEAGGAGRASGTGPRRAGRRP